MRSSAAVTELLTERPEAEPAPLTEPHPVRPPSRSVHSSSTRRWWRDALRRRLLAIADLCAAAIATLVVIVPITGEFWALVLLPSWPLMAKLFGLYDRDHRALRHLTADEVPVILAWVASVTALTALILSLTSSTAPDGPAIVRMFIGAAIVATGLRALTRWAWWRRTPPELVGLVGDGKTLESLRRKFELFREMHLELIAERQIVSLGPVGEMRSQQLVSLAEGVDRIVVAATDVEVDLIGELKEICHRSQVKLSVVSPLRGKALPAERFSRLADLPILEYNTWDPSRSTLVIKRLFDALLAAVGLILFAPFLAIIAILIKLDSPGPVFFSQIRAGIGGRPFRMYKLRTMETASRGSPRGPGRHSGPERAGLQAERRSARDQVRPLAATVQHRRGPAADQRPGWRDEHRRAASRAGRARCPLLAGGAVQADREARDHGPDADLRTRRADLRGAPGGRVRIRGLTLAR